VADSCESGNESSGSVKGVEFLDQVCVLLSSEERVTDSSSEKKRVAKIRFKLYSL
jgi:hypothetical protein